MCKRSGCILLAALLYVCHAVAQDNGAFLDDFSRFRQQALSEQRDFRQKAISEYADFLRQAWHNYDLMRPIKPRKEKWIPPTRIPKDVEPVKNKPIDYDDVIAIPKPADKEKQPQPIEPVEEHKEDKETQLSTGVYCLDIIFRADKKKLPHLANTSNAEIARMWTQLSEKQYGNLLYDCLQNRSVYHFCDWVYLHMLDSVSQECYGKSNEATLLMAYLYQQSGYKMRLAKDDSGELVLLFASEAKLFNYPFITIDKEPFYVYGSHQKKLTVCDAAFPGEKSLSLDIREDMSSSMIVTCGLTDVRVRKAERYPDWYMGCSVMDGMLDLYTDYPSGYMNGNEMTRWALLANTPWQLHLVYDSLVWLPSVKRELSAFPELEQVERLLNWVQTGFDYKTDEEVWGRERAFFAEETIYYPYCDCEDRSILFSKLVRDVVGLKVLLVYYPGHMATAVKFNSEVAGDYILLNGDRYVVCDPTYINATVGMTMPNMDNQKAKVILLD